MRVVCLVGAGVLAAGCTAGSGGSGTGGSGDGGPATRRPTAASAPPSGPPARPSPVPTVHSEGRTRVLEYGDLVVRATPEAGGVRTEVAVTNTNERRTTYSVQITLADGAGWTAYDRFWLQGVPPGGTRRDDAVIGSAKTGPVPRVPKIYVDEFTPLVDRN